MSGLIAELSYLFLHYLIYCLNIWRKSSHTWICTWKQEACHHLKEPQTLLWGLLLHIKTQQANLTLDLKTIPQYFWFSYLSSSLHLQSTLLVLWWRILCLITILLEFKGTSNRCGPSIRQSLISSTAETQLNVSDVINICILKNTVIIH